MNNADKSAIDFTLLLRNAQSGDSLAEQQFFELVNDELRWIARSLVDIDDRQVAPATSLVDEAFLKLFRLHDVDLKNRRYVFSVAAEEMRRILRERNRARKTIKAGANYKPVPLEIAIDEYLDQFKNKHNRDFEDLDLALEWLKNQPGGKRQYEVAVHRFLIGLTVEKTAEMLDIDRRTVARDWQLAEAKLAGKLGENRL